MADKKPTIPGSKGINRLKEEIARELGVHLNISTKPRRNNKSK
ncbi:MULTISPECIES: small, acid-soluble spore protein, alpha/beta type [unclassified Bacillus (in: firmicutes)]|nr:MULTISPECIES: small, acid-soluble spore protein, alpha/beta type [unclassified Bacillus (in: firmicutes)]